MPEIKFEITEKLGVLSENEKGWKKELNIVSWSEAEPKYDLRTWNDTHERMGKGITITKATFMWLFLYYKQIMSLIFSYFALPMPGTFFISSKELKFPFSFL